MDYLLGVDFGGGSAKATLADTSGRIVWEGDSEYATLHPENGACEQRPSDWTETLCILTRRLFAETEVKPREIICVAIDSATHSFVLCGADMAPLCDAVHWTDSRGREQSDRLRERYGDVIFEKTFHKPDTIWTLPQLLRIKETDPELFSRVRHILFEKDFIRYFLTGVICTDFIEAEGSMLFDATAMKWDPFLCSLAGVDMSVLPGIVRPADIIGRVTAAAAGLTGLAEGTDVICGTTDTVMEVFASGAVNARNITVKLATAGRICVITERPHPDRHLVNYSHISEGLWYPGTATKAAASSYRWYRDTFGGSYKDLDAGASGVPVGSDGLIYHPYINGELTPYADPMLCGSFTGIRSTHTKAHFTRAVLEGVSLSLLDGKRYLDTLGILYDDTATLIGGGAKGNLWKQITSDVLGMSFRTTENSDSSFGSAMLAGIAKGVFESPEDAVRKCVRVTGTVTPDPENTARYSEIFARYKKIHDALAPVYDEI